MYFCFHSSISCLFIVDRAKYRRWWNILNFSIKILIYYFYFSCLPRHPSALLRLYSFCLFVCSFLLVVCEQRDRNFSLAVCTHVWRNSQDLVIPVSLPSLVLDVLTFRWVTKCIIFWLLDWFHMWTSFQMPVLNILVYLQFAWHIEQNSIRWVYKMTYLQACNSAESARWLGNS